MASKIHQDYIARHPSRVKDVTNVEFVTKKLDEAMDNHDHDGVNSPQIDLSLNYDFNAAGGNVYVKTPGVSSDQEEYPPTGDLYNVYTKTEVDQRLGIKSNVGHMHNKNEITNFPDSLKNPNALSINDIPYDGSYPVSLKVATSENLTEMIENSMQHAYAILGEKAEAIHTHNEEDIANLDRYTKLETDNLLNYKSNRGHSHIESEISDLNKYTRQEVDDLIEEIGKNIKDSLYPKGSIYISATLNDPSSFIGGVWQLWGSGRVPVGVDSTQTEFDSVEKEGGAKTHTLSIGEMPNHDHGMTIGTGSGSVVLGSQTMEPVMSETTRTSFAGSDAAHNNLQPYITCYMWKRVS